MYMYIYILYIYIYVMSNQSDLVLGRQAFISKAGRLFWV